MGRAAWLHRVGFLRVEEKRAEAFAFRHSLCSPVCFREPRGGPALGVGQHEIVHPLFPFRQQRQRVVNKAIACAIVLLAIGSGVLAVEWTAWGDNARYETFSNEDFAMAQWIERNTPENALFLSSGFHQNPVPALAGRQIIAGYEGWLWSHW